MGQTQDLIITPHKQRADSQRVVLEQMEISLQTPAATVGQQRLRERQPLGGDVGHLDLPAHASHALMDRGGVASYLGDLVADRPFGLLGSIRTTSAATDVPSLASLLVDPVRLQKSLYICSAKTAATACSNSQPVLYWVLPRPGGGVKPRIAASALANRRSSAWAWL